MLHVACFIAKSVRFMTALYVGGTGCVRGRTPAVLRSGGLEADGDAAKQCVVRACCGEGDANACGGRGDTCGDRETHPQGGELGVGERLGLSMASRTVSISQ